MPVYKCKNCDANLNPGLGNMEITKFHDKQQTVRIIKCPNCGQENSFREGKEEEKKNGKEYEDQC